MNAANSGATFLIQSRHVHVWSEVWHALAFSLTGTGGALYSYLVFAGIFQKGQSAAVALVALVLVSLGALIIFTLEITYRGVFLRYFLSNLGQSWISRGVLALLIFGILSILALLLDTFAGSFQALNGALAILAALAGLFVIVYPGLVLSTAAIPFWRSALLPLEFLVSGGIGGLAIVLLWQVTGDAGISLNAPLVTFVSLLLLNLILHLIHLATVSTSTRRETIELLTGGELKTSFVVGFFILGIGAPLALVAIGYVFGDLRQSPILFITAILALMGIFFQRYSVLRGGIKPALL